MVKRMVIGLCGLLVMSLMSVTHAHDPAIEDSDWGSFDAPHPIVDSAISYALYGYLDESDVDAFALDFAAAGDLLRIELLTPVCGAHYEAFLPQFVILLAADQVAEPLAVDLPFDLPEDQAVWFASFQLEPEIEATPEASPTPRPTFTEPFGGTEFYEAARYDLEVPASGLYTVVVFDPQGMSGDYTLATGYREEFNSPREQMLSAVAAIRDGSWLHRRCDLAPDDPAAVVEHEHTHDG
jgi:hypothetical protein